MDYRSSARTHIGGRAERGLSLARGEPRLGTVCKGRSANAGYGVAKAGLDVGGRNQDRTRWKRCPDSGRLWSPSALNALATNVAADLLSAPSVLTLDNEEAKNLVGQNVPFRSGSFTTTADGIGNPFSTVQRQDIGITLTVTPHIHEGTSVRLEVLLTVENLVDSGLGSSALESADFITQKREIDTTVLADDGQTIVLGGLIQDDIRESMRKVPLLGDVPAVGRLFRSNRETRAKRNLLVFLRPTVLHSGQDVKETTERLYDRIREFQLHSRAEAATPVPEALYDGRANALAPDPT